ncbi:MAG: hypothetical protein FDZ75_01510 [Actinobacteria bacterium]|nr:MAG: hypothetical protein FDZ75_01510 [Actinomycetota bacterium]
MMKSKWIRALLVIAAVTALAIGGFVLAGAAKQETTITAADTAAMRALVDEYWSAKEYIWPAESRGKSKLTAEERDRLRLAHKTAVDKIAGGNIKEWEDGFDPAGFLEEQRASGTVATAVGHRIVATADPELVDEGLAKMKVTMWVWSEQYDCDAAGEPTGASYKTDNTTEYEYTYERTGNGWRVTNEDVLTSPLDSDPDSFGPSL